MIRSTGEFVPAVRPPPRHLQTVRSMLVRSWLRVLVGIIFIVIRRENVFKHFAAFLTNKVINARVFIIDRCDTVNLYAKTIWTTDYHLLTSSALLPLPAIVQQAD
jgi:hypothetical protein